MIAIIDSGVHASHPHVGGVAGGIAFNPDGSEHDDFVDRLGHGTAVTAVIREKMPAADIYAIKVFDRTLATSAAALVKAIDWAIARNLRLVNLSLGTTNPAHEVVMSEAVQRARNANVLIVSACTVDQRWLPGSLPGVIAVDVDWTCERDAYTSVHDAAMDRWTFLASGYPRDIPGVPRERNLKGVSFAVANMAGIVARLLVANPDIVAFEDVTARLARG